MAFQLGIKVSLAADKKSIVIKDENTIWGDGINSSVDLTTMDVVILGEDKDTPLYTLHLSDAEKNSFATGITIFFEDTRWFFSEFPPDNFYVAYVVGDGTHNSDWEAFEIHLEIARLVHINNATVNLRPQDLFALENNMQSVIGLDTMENIANDKYSPDREYRWRKLYNYIRDNIINKY